ncbi:hypothetical protein D3C75_872700 [compost metagenome]
MLEKLLKFLTEINLLIAFLVLLAGHFMMYFLLDNENWIALAFAASLTDTAVLAGLQLYAMFKTKAK